MIVDLLRNDLGRVARTGTVAWSDVFAAERFETVWQLTSTVAADLRSDASLRRRLPGAVPVRLGDRRAEGLHDGDHRRAGARRAGRLLRHGRLSRARRGARVRALGSTWRSGPWCTMPRPAMPPTGSAAASRGTRRPARSTTRPSRRRGCSPTRRPRIPAAGDARARCRASGYRRLERTSSPGSAASADYFGIQLDEAAIAAALDREAGRFPHEGRRGCACWSIVAAGSRSGRRR